MNGQWIWKQLSHSEKTEESGIKHNETPRKKLTCKQFS